MTGDRNKEVLKASTEQSAFCGTAVQHFLALCADLGCRRISRTRRIHCSHLRRRRACHRSLRLLGVAAAAAVLLDTLHVPSAVT
jgi:hypothetical protein